MKRKFLLITFLILLLNRFTTLVIPGCVYAEENSPSIKVSVDKNKIDIGDIVHYQIRLNIPKGIAVKNYPEKTDRLGDFTVKNFTKSKAKGKSNELVFDYAITLFKTGKHSIPGYNLEYRQDKGQDWQALHSRSLEVTVESVLDKDKSPTLKGLKPRIIIWQDYVKWIILILIVIALVAGALKLRRRRHPLPDETVKLEPAHVIALRELEELQKLKLPERGFIEEYFEKLSGILRRYLENRFKLRAPWMSTEEFLTAAKTSAQLDIKQRGLLKDFLNLSDLVKFARYGSSPEEAEKSFLSARNFIEQTRETPAEEENTKK